MKTSEHQLAREIAATGNMPPVCPHGSGEKPSHCRTCLKVQRRALILALGDLRSQLAHLKGQVVGLKEHVATLTQLRDQLFNELSRGPDAYDDYVDPSVLNERINALDLALKALKAVAHVA